MTQTNSHGEEPPKPPEVLEEARFAASVQRLREQAGISQTALARQMSEAGWSGFHQTTISRIEKGVRPVRLGEARALARLLGSSVPTMYSPVGLEQITGELRQLETVLSESLSALARNGVELVQRQADARSRLIALERQAASIMERDHLDDRAPKVRQFRHALEMAEKFARAEWADTVERALDMDAAMDDPDSPYYVPDDGEMDAAASRAVDELIDFKRGK